MSVRLQLPEKWVEYLTRQPESGMGYQRVNVVFEDGVTVEDCVVFNAEEIEVPDAFAGRRIEGLAVRGPSRPQHDTVP